jgi:hypothetical protein
VILRNRQKMADETRRRDWTTFRHAAARAVAGHSQADPLDDLARGGDRNSGVGTGRHPACSRFRPDSEISARTPPAAPPCGSGRFLPRRCRSRCGRRSSPNSRRFRDDDSAIASVGPAPGWWRLGWDAGRRVLLVPRRGAGPRCHGQGASTDRIAARSAEAAGCGLLVSLGGDVAVAGDPPQEGWPVGALRSPTSVPSVMGATL